MSATWYDAASGVEGVVLDHSDVDTLQDMVGDVYTEHELENLPHIQQLIAAIDYLQGLTATRFLIVPFEIGTVIEVKVQL
jgi:hypothetical protein